MKFKNAIMVLAAGMVALPFASSNAQAGDLVTLAPSQVRTYCKTDPIRRNTSATADYDALAGVDSPDFTADDDNTTAGGTEVVWQVIGSLVTPAGNEAGEGYCGALPLAGGFQFSTNDVATAIEDCVTVASFDLSGVESGNLPVHTAALDWSGSNLGVRLSISVSACEYGGPGAIDNFGEDADGDGEVDETDCITDGDNFAGGSFAAINDVNLRKADNNPTLSVGGVSDINFGEVFPSRMIELNDLGVNRINNAADRDGSVAFIVRCADEDGHENGFLGGNGGPFAAGTNALIIHDPAGIGFGLPGALNLVLNHNGTPEANDDSASYPR